MHTNVLVSFAALALAATSASATKDKNLPACLPTDSSKKDVCSILSQGGLVNLQLLGCSKIDIS